MTVLKTLMFTVLVPGTVTVFVPYWLLSSSSFQPSWNLGVFRHLGVILILIGLSIYLWCAWDFTFTGHGTPAPIDPPTQLVVRGLYRFTRNPMYVGILTLLVGEALFFESRVLFLHVALVCLGFYLFVVFYEEPVLHRKFGESYRQYCDAVPRWLIRWKR